MADTTLQGKRIAVLAAEGVEQVELTELGHSGGDQQQLLRPQEEVRRERAAEAARQVRAGMGEGHLLRVVEVAPWSRIPEGRSLLVPFEG